MFYKKFKATPTYIDGIRFASKKEAKRYEELIQLKNNNEIIKIKNMRE